MYLHVASCLPFYDTSNKINQPVVLINLGLLTQMEDLVFVDSWIAWRTKNFCDKYQTFTGSVVSHDIHRQNLSQNSDTPPIR